MDAAVLLVLLLVLREGGSDRIGQDAAIDVRWLRQSVGALLRALVVIFVICTLEASHIKY
jgi:hypothetical protein